MLSPLFSPFSIQRENGVVTVVTSSQTPGWLPRLSVTTGADRRHGRPPDPPPLKRPDEAVRVAVGHVDPDHYAAVVGQRKPSRVELPTVPATKADSVAYVVAPVPFLRVDVGALQP